MNFPQMGHFGVVFWAEGSTFRGDGWSCVGERNQHLLRDVYGASMVSLLPVLNAEYLRAVFAFEGQEIWTNAGGLTEVGGGRRINLPFVLHTAQCFPERKQRRANTRVKSNTRSTSPFGGGKGGT